MWTPMKNTTGALAIKSAAAEARTVSNGLISWLDIADGESELEHTSTQVPLTEMQRGKTKVQQNSYELWGHIKARTHSCFW